MCFPSQTGQAEGSHAEAHRREALPVYAVWRCLCPQLRPEEPHARAHRLAALSVLQLLQDFCALGSPAPPPEEGRLQRHPLPPGQKASGARAGDPRRSARPAQPGGRHEPRAPKRQGTAALGTVAVSGDGRSWRGSRTQSSGAGAGSRDESLRRQGQEDTAGHQSGVGAACETGQRREEKSQRQTLGKIESN